MAVVPGNPGAAADEAVLQAVYRQDRDPGQQHGVCNNCALPPGVIPDAGGGAASGSLYRRSGSGISLPRL
jgi:hypothetical protein